MCEQITILLTSATHNLLQHNIQLSVVTSKWSQCRSIQTEHLLGMHAYVKQPTLHTFR